MPENSEECESLHNKFPNLCISSSLVYPICTISSQQFGSHDKHCLPGV